MVTDTPPRIDHHHHRRGLRGLVARHPLRCYFAMAFGVTWLAWAPYILSAGGLGLLPFRMPELFGSDQTLGVLPGGYVGPILAAFTVTALSDGKPGLRRWGRRLARWRVSWRWYLVVLLGVPAALILATLPLPGALADVRLPTTAALLSYLPLLALQALTTGVAEEPGWRDFALPRLQDRYGPLAGTLILGPLWGAWHLPLFFSAWAGWPDVDWVLAVEFMASAIPVSIVMTWVFNRTGESLPMMILLHAGINTVSSWVWEEMFPSLEPFGGTLHALFISSVVLAVVLLVATRGRLGYRRG